MPHSADRSDEPSGRPQRSRSATALTAIAACLAPALSASAQVVISQVYGGNGSTYGRDYVEIFNRGSVPTSVAGWSIQYASATGSGNFAQNGVTTLSGTLQPGQYYLVGLASAASGASLPAPDASGTTNLSASNGKVALVNTSAGLACNGSGGQPCDAGQLAQIVDLVGYGSANFFESAAAPALTTTTALLRADGGCTDTNNNASNFGAGAPVPRNSASPLNPCGADQAPAVSSTVPANGASNVTLGASITVNFTEPVSLAAGAVGIECPAGNPVASSAAASGVSSVQITPAAPLPGATTCAIEVTAVAVTDVDAIDPPDTMATDFAATFSTVGASTCSAPDTPIGAVQGTGATSPVAGSTRTVQGVVVGDYEFPGSGTSSNYLRGFYVQNAPSEADGDPATSDAIFVFNGNGDSVSLGQVVQVTGTVTEFDYTGAGPTLTELTSATIEVCATSAALTPTPMSLPFADAAEPERFEGMLVQLTQTLYVTEHFQLGRFGQVTLSANARLLQPTTVAAPGPAALALQAANDLHRIVLDDELQLQNPDPIVFARGGLPLSAANTLRGGDSVSGIVGVLTHTDATPESFVPVASDPMRYRVRPVGALGGTLPNFVASNARPTPAAALGGRLRVAGFNLLNYFNTFGATACTNGVGGGNTECRGAADLVEFNRQWPKTIAAIVATGADVLALSELENDGYGATSSIRDLVDKLNTATAPGTYAFIDADAGTGAVNALGVDAIRVGLLFKPGKVMPIGETAALNTGAFGLFTTTSGAIQRNRPALAQTFEELGTGARFTVVANHLKSKGSECTDNIAPVGPDPDAGDGQGNCNLTRKAAAEQMAVWLAGDPTETGDTDVLIMGDLNAYAQEDPVTALLAAGYANLVADQLGPAAYSYVFDGQWGYLDHALASTTLVDQVADVVEWHINADEPNVLDYNTDFKSTGQIASLYAADVFRTSDHDPVLVGLDLALPDSDGDGVPDAVEAATCTNSLDADSDDDGLADGVEDTNGDGVVQAGETNPCSADSDGDGLQDGTELGVTQGVPDDPGLGLLGTATGAFVPDADPATQTNPLASDTDGDGLTDGQEDVNGNGRIDLGESDPNGAQPSSADVPIPLPALVALGALFAALGARRPRKATS